ncbi:MAG TPA: DUF2442 domain-containing protein [Myxococcota bacterium]|nr:DUF2442 domain-containing protein [Myxococcota bacterium]
MKAKHVHALDRYRVEIIFEDGAGGEIVLNHLAGKGVFAAWEAPGAFENVSVGSGGEVCWACGVDLCADALYLRLTGKRAEQLLPGLDTESRVA